MWRALSISLLLALRAQAAALGSRQANAGSAAGLGACPVSGYDADYIVIGSGAGGGPVASRLALAGYKVLVLEHGHDINNINTTIPLYFARSNEDPQLALDYYVDHYPAGYPKQVKPWYPRASGLGGSTIHNALVNVLQVDEDFNRIAQTTGDFSWSADSMRNYFVKMEKNLYIDSNSAQSTGHGFSGWLSTTVPPPNLITDAKYYDPQLIDVATGIQGMAARMPQDDFNTLGADGIPGGGNIILTKDATGNRSSVRDFLFQTNKKIPQRLVLSYNSMATKLVFCTPPLTNAPMAYGVEVASGSDLLPVARNFKGKAKLKTKVYTARYEVIVSAGAFQTPQLLKLSGIGPKTELDKFGIKTIANLPGVGENLQDRLEISVVYKLKQDHVLFKGCKFGDDPAKDPCLADWISTGHTNLYSAGPGFWATTDKSSASLPWLDLWTSWAPALFKGYYRGYPLDTANSPNALSAIILKAHTAAKGWVRLTSSDPQDLLEINKNQFQTDASKQDLTILREAIKSTRATVNAQSGISAHIDVEDWPGPSVSTDAQIDDFIVENGWGHHVCCTAKIGADNDQMAVLDSRFNVRGVLGLRVVDISVFPDIPGIFVTTPVYMIAEKAADVILDDALRANRKPST